MPKHNQSSHRFFFCAFVNYILPLRLPNDSCCLVFMTLCNPFPLSVGWQKWWDVTSEIRWQKSGAFIFSVLSHYFLLAHSGESQGPCCKVPYREAHLARNWGRPSVNTQWRIEALSQHPMRNLNLPTIVWVILEVDRSPFEPSDRIAVLADSMTAVP